jgi:hypothetical protein
MINAGSARVSYLENGTTTTHAIPFPFVTGAEIRVYRKVGRVKTLLANPTHYSVTGGNGSTGAIVKTSGGTVGATLIIERFTERAQRDDYNVRDSFPSDRIEKNLDRLTAIAQEQDRAIVDEGDARAEDMSRALRLPAGELVAELPAASARADRYLAGLSNGGFIFKEGTGGVDLVDLTPLGAVAVTDTGADRTGSIDATDACHAAALAGDAVLFPPGLYKIASDMTLTKPAVFAPGAKLLIGNAVTASLAEFSAPIARVFDCAGSGKVVFNRAKIAAGYAEWWGAAANDPATDSTVALNAALEALPHVQLLGSYYTSATIVVAKNGTRLTGNAHTQTDQNSTDVGNQAQILCTDAAATILRIGSASSTDPRNAGGDLVEAVWLEGFTCDRTVDPYMALLATDSAMGIDVRWCVNCHFDRVFSLNSCIGWQFYGTVQHYARFCAALREREGSDPAHDVFIGFYIDQAAPTSYNGGNASLRLLWCRSFHLTDDAAPALAYSAGIRFDGGWVDTDIVGFETGGGIQFGIHGIGDGLASASFRGENLKVTSCNFDPGSVACIWLEKSGPRSAVVIENNYFATTGTALHIEDFGGTVVLANNQFITPALGYTGISLTNVAHLRSENNIFTGFAAPIVLSLVSNFTIRDTINGSYGASALPAISVNACFRGVVDPVINGVGNAYGFGVKLLGTLNSFVEVNCTTINAPAINGGSGNKLYHNASQITATGAFGTSCLARGIMT